MVIGRQVGTAHGGRIDLLAISEDGSLTVIELKRDKTSRDIVAQILDYASWVGSLDTPESLQLQMHTSARGHRILRKNSSIDSKDPCLNPSISRIGWS